MQSLAEQDPVEGSAIKKHRVVSRWWIGGGLVAICVFLVIATVVQVWWTSSHYETAAEADAIVVLGAAQWDGTPSPVFEQRLLRAFDLYEQGVSRFIVTTGANQPGDRVTEGFAGYEFLRNQGVPDPDILVVTDGTSTWEQLTATNRVLADRDLDSVVLVSDPYHNYRLLQMADAVGLAASVAPTDLDPTVQNFARESAASIAGRVLGWRRASNLG